MNDPSTDLAVGGILLAMYYLFTRTPLPQEEEDFVPPKVPQQVQPQQQVQPPVVPQQQVQQPVVRQQQQVEQPPPTQDNAPNELDYIDDISWTGWIGFPTSGKQIL